jgi:hypothetical protein
VCFHLGEASTPEDLDQAVNALNAPADTPPTFVASEPFGRTPVPTMARMLWAAGMRSANNPAPTTGRLTTTPASVRIGAFPLAPATRAFLDGDLEMSGLIRMSSMDRRTVTQDVRVLLALGVFRAPSSEAHADRVARRRRRDAERELAQQLLQKAPLASVAEVPPPKPPRPSPRARVLTLNNAWEVGQAEFNEGNYSNAVKAFAMLKRAQPFNGRVVAWLGYALFHDPSFPRAKREARGRRFLEQAASMGSHRGDAHVLQARLDIADGDLVRAWTRLDRAVVMHPTNGEARALRDDVKREVQA